MAIADDGRPADGAPLMQRAWDALRGPTPFAAAGFLFQWGRIYEEAGETGVARDRYELAWRAVPRHHEAATHYAGTLALTGDRDTAIEVLEGELATQATPHPETEAALAQLLAQRDPARAHALAVSARAGWERYIAALPEAFADHAARFYLAPGEMRDPARALVLARLSYAQRPNAQAEALLEQAERAARAR
jgi:hypothetical protein